MTDGVVQSVIFMSKLPENSPKMRRNCPNTALKLLPNLPKKRIVSEGQETARTLPRERKRTKPKFCP